MRLNGAMIFVKDLPRMAAFYTDTLGLKPIGETGMETWVEFDTGDARFSLHAIPAPSAAEIEIASPPEPRERVPVKLFFEVEDAGSECARLESLGVTILRRPWGASEAVDPEGNIFQIRSRVSGP